MKKRIAAVVMGLIMAAGITGCNYSGYDAIDTNYHFDRCQIKMPDGTIVEGNVARWADAEDGEQITITLDNGKRYMTNSCNVVLIEE